MRRPLSTAMPAAVALLAAARAGARPGASAHRSAAAAAFVVGTRRSTRRAGSGAASISGGPDRADGVAAVPRERPATARLRSTTAPDPPIDVQPSGSDAGADAHADADATPLKVNIHTIPKPDLEQLLQSWGHPKYRATQILKWVRERGVSSFDDMTDLPAKLREDLRERARIGSLEVAVEMKSNDGTRKRAYRLWDGQLIESVLMPYEDGRNTACVSSQAGCAMGCVFCATGQMGFARQLTSDEIFEQVARFAAEIKAESGGKKRLTNVVMMGMGEPLANYRNLMTAVRRMNDELGIGARRITVSTVGVVPNIRKLAREDLQVKLAVSLHCSTEEERSALLPANGRYGGIDELLSAVKEYIDITKRRVTFEWALIEGQNDTPEVARSLGNLLKRHGIRRDMSHVNVIPLNPTGGFGGSPSRRRRVGTFVWVLEEEFGIGATPRMRRGIDIDAGCGQLKAAVKKKERRGANDASGQDIPGLNAAKDELQSFIDVAAPPPTASFSSPPIVGVYEEDERASESGYYRAPGVASSQLVDFTMHDAVLDLDEHEGEVIDDEFDQEEADRLIALVQGSFPAPPPSCGEDGGAKAAAALVGPAAVADKKKNTTTTITDEGAIRDAKRRRKKLLKNLRMIDRLREIESSGRTLNEEQLAKVGREAEWRAEVESLEHNLK